MKSLKFRTVSDSISKEKKITLLKKIPQIGKILEKSSLKKLLESYPRPLLLKAIRDHLETLRENILAGRLEEHSLEESSLIHGFRERILQMRRGDLRRVINATGIVVHTNLGRCPFSSRVIQRLVAISEGYSNLEYALEERGRGGRMKGISDRLCALTNAESVYVVNNNAAAVMLGLSTVARDREVILSRGELVEIGGSFRIPDVMRASGVTLREVGTTNRTHLRDYEDAIGPNTSMLLKVHPSNYVVKGFSSEVSLQDIVSLGKKYSLPVMIDLGSGRLCSVPTHSFLANEPLLSDVVQTGVDIITCSGDKLIGGPQSGLLLGSKAWIAKMAKHPLARAFRVDKLTLGALEETLQIYIEGSSYAKENIPVLSMLFRDVEELERIGIEVLARITPLRCLSLFLDHAESPVGGGALPEVFSPTIRIGMESSLMQAHEMDRWLRGRVIPVVSLLEKGRIFFDLRSLLNNDLEVLVETIGELDQAIASLQRIRHH